jgi:V8-like Glu-specific endopeptidase
MGSGGAHHGRRAVAAGTLAALALAAVIAAPRAGAARASTAGSHPDIGVVHTLDPAARQSALTFWTRSRMETATPAPPAGPAAPAGVTAGSAARPPRGIPSPASFDGVPTVGALFYTTGTARHFCTASVVSSVTENLVLTAAHCVYSGTYAGNIEFVPGYHNGLDPYGTWAVKTITVAAGWARSQDPDLDFAFLSVTPASGTQQPIQRVTGALRLGIHRPYDRPIEAIGYNNTGQKPIECATRSFEFEPGQMEFYCRDYRAGTSGGPWIVRYDRANGSGLVVGVIGGYERGGDYPWASYSPYFARQALDLFLEAERQ